MNKLDAPKSNVVELLQKVGISIITYTSDLEKHCTGSAPVPDINAVPYLAAVAVAPERKFTAVDVLHEAAHLIAARGKTARGRLRSIEWHEEDAGTLQVECRLWNKLGFTDEEVYSSLEDEGYSVENWQKWNRNSSVTRGLVQRGLLLPATEAINLAGARRWVRLVTAVS